jgi:hypothetical protein
VAVALNWSVIEKAFDADADLHWHGCRTAGLNAPFDVFEQLFHDRHGDAAFAADLVAVDWSRLVWSEELFTGVRLRQVAAPRGYEYAIDEARARTARYGLKDERPEVVASWQQESTWVRAPVIIDGGVLSNLHHDELRVGFTRVGDLLGLLDRGEVKETATHRVWVGRMQA